MDNTLGIVIGGNSQQILVRIKSDFPVMLGSLASVKNGKDTLLFQVVELIHGSQISSINKEFISGLMLEEQATDLELLDAKQRNYILAQFKPLVTLLPNNKILPSKSLPPLFAEVLVADPNNFSFLSPQENALTFGNLRSGSLCMEQKVALDGSLVFQHHILIAAQTGKGKSNLTKCLLWSVLQQNYCGMLVLDAHDEYFDKNQQGLSQFPDKSKLCFYSPKPQPGNYSLSINIKNLKPQHFLSVSQWSEPQIDFLYTAQNKFAKDWIETVLTSNTAELITMVNAEFKEATVNVVKRKLQSLLQIEVSEEKQSLLCKSIFQVNQGETTISDICTTLESAKSVVINTSMLTGATELLLSVILASQIFYKYQHYKREGVLDKKPTISFVLEEAPRVLGRDALEKGNNIFATIAKEGRKFKVGLTAITQLPSLIPREILANLSTKIILGLELGIERHAIIESSAQDLSLDETAIASLDKGEAILTSNFSRCAVPFAIPLFEDLVKKEIQSSGQEGIKKAFPELKP